MTFEPNFIPVGPGELESVVTCPQCFGAKVTLVNRTLVPTVVAVCKLCKGAGTVTAVYQTFADIPKHRSAYPRDWWIYRCPIHGLSRALYSGGDPPRKLDRTGTCGRGGDGYLEDGCGRTTKMLGNACWECEGDTLVECDACGNSRLQSSCGECGQELSQPVEA